MSSEEIKRLFPLIKSNYSGTYVTGGGHVDGEALIKSLQNKVIQNGGKIFREKIILERFDNNQIKIISKEDSFYHFDFVLLSVGAWLAELLKPLGYVTDIRPQKGKLFSIYNEKWKNQNWPVVIAPDGADIIPFNNGKILVGATHENDKGFDIGIDIKRVNELKDKASQWISVINEYPLDKIKVGIRAYTSDYSVLIGQVPHLENVWAISGLGSSGLTSGPYLGYQWNKLIQKGEWDICTDNYPIEKYISLNK